MSNLVNIITPLHTKTKRDYIGRMLDDKVNCMIKAKEYGFEYWDGDRKYGYGGYKYDGRWKIVAETLIETYGLRSGARVLDVGCGKAHLLYELSNLLPDVILCGFDVSRYAIAHAPAEVRDNLFVYRAHDTYPYGSDCFDLVISVNTLHNLRLFELETSLSEIERVGRRKFILVESYRNEQELFNLQCWGLTPQAFYDADEWVWMFKHFNYTGDYEFIYFE